MNQPSKDEFEVIERRQAMRVLEPAPPDKRDPRLTIAAICIGVSLAALLVSLILEVLNGR